MDKREQFAELFRAEYPGLIRELSVILGDRLLAEDVAAEAFVDLWRSWERVSGFDRPGAWVRLVSIRKAGRASWRRRRRAQVEATFAPGSSPNERDVDLTNALRELSEAQRIAIVMHHLGGWPTTDIAKVLECADVTVRSHLSRGRQRLAALLAEGAGHTKEDDVGSQ